MASAGLALAEAHEVLSGIQHHLAAAQAAAAAVAGRPCGDCGRPRARKDTRHIVLRTLFGTLRLESPRYKACPCAVGGPATVSPVAALLPERTTPELLLWEARYAALTSYGAVASLLGEAFPSAAPCSPLRSASGSSAPQRGWKTSSVRNGSASLTPAPPDGRRCPGPAAGQALPVARQHLPRRAGPRGPPRQLRDRLRPPTRTTSSERSSSGSASPAPTSGATARRSPTTASATAAASRSPRPPPRVPSTRSSAAAWSRSSRCAGRPAAPTSSCRSAPASSSLSSQRVEVLYAIFTARHSYVQQDRDGSAAQGATGVSRREIAR